MTKQGAKNQGREGDFHLRPRGKQNKGEATKLQDKQEGAVIKLNRARLASGLASAPERARHEPTERRRDGAREYPCFPAVQEHEKNRVSIVYRHRTTRGRLRGDLCPFTKLATTD
jgi:hypothetical protein